MSIVAHSTSGSSAYRLPSGHAPQAIAPHRRASALLLVRDSSSSPGAAQPAASKEASDRVRNWVRFIEASGCPAPRWSGRTIHPVPGARADDGPVASVQLQGPARRAVGVQGVDLVDRAGAVALHDRAREVV